jgi:hypothetical protein
MGMIAGHKIKSRCYYYSGKRARHSEAGRENRPKPGQPVTLRFGIRQGFSHPGGENQLLIDGCAASGANEKVFLENFFFGVRKAAEDIRLELFVCSVN